MAVTVKSLKSAGLPKFLTITEVTFDNSYAEGGEPFTPAQAGLLTIDHSWVNIKHGSESSTLRPTSCYYEGEKLHLIDSATGKEIASTSDMSKVVVEVFAIGKGRSK